MSSLSFLSQHLRAGPAGLSIPDINVWMALTLPEHPHNGPAARWWQRLEGRICFVRLSQMGLLRLATTASAMSGRPLSMTQAWQLYDEFFLDERVGFLPEPANIEVKFRERAAGHSSSPKVWGDAWMLAHAEMSGGVLVTFDKALGPRGAHCLSADAG
jgi:toxin-antitoxin system PIN domain toxin